MGTISLLGAALSVFVNGTMAAILALTSGVLFIGAAILEALRSHRKLLEGMPKTDSDRQPCPFCAEDIRPEANVCPYCRSDLRQATSAADRLLDSERPHRPDPSRR
jgi:hypothetical protein